MVAGLAGLPLVRPHTSSLARARRRIGAAPFKALFATVAGPVAWRDTPGATWCGLRTVAIDATVGHIPDSQAIGCRYPKRHSETLEFGYPLLRLVTVIETGTRAILAAAFGPESDGELSYAQRLLGTLGARMLVGLDAGFDAWEFLRDVQVTRAQFLVRSSARRCPTIGRRFPDGSYLTRLGYGRLPVRVVEAWITVTLDDGTIHREQWRLLTSLMDHHRYPADRLVALYHERWQAETTYATLKSIMLDGRVLRSQRPEEIDQEIYALLTVYQVLIRIAADAAASCPSLDMDRLSFTVLGDAAGNQVSLAAGIWPTGPALLVGAIGHTVLGHLLPVHRRQRLKARTRKNLTSTYGPNAGQHPRTSQHYIITTQIQIMEEGLTARLRR